MRDNGSPSREAAGTLHVQGEVAVAELEPGLPAEPRQRIPLKVHVSPTRPQPVPGLATPASV